MFGNVAREQHADGCADTGGCSDNSLRHVEMSGTIGDIHNDKRDQHTENRSRDAIKHLNYRQQVRIMDKRKQDRSRHKSTNPDKQEWTASPRLRTTSGPWGHYSNDDLRNDHASGDQRRGGTS